MILHQTNIALPSLCIINTDNRLTETNLKKKYRPTFENLPIAYPFLILNDKMGRVVE